MTYETTLNSNNIEDGKTIYVANKSVFNTKESEPSIPFTKLADELWVMPRIQRNTV